MNWENKITVKKGNFGEDIVRKSFEKKGYVVYKCITEKAHAFDFLAVKDKKVFLIAEIKSKARLNKFYATGIDTRHYNEYLVIMDNMKMDIILFFVDEHPKEERIYCQKLSILKIEKKIDNIKFPNTTIARNITLFSLTDMIEVKKLNLEELQTLKTYSSRNYTYD
jgi:hypothetical protein